MGYTVQKATLNDCLKLGRKMRESDKQEIWSSGRFTPIEGLVEGLKSSGKHSYALLLNGEVVGLFGVSPSKNNMGVVWVMGSDKMTSNKKEFYKISKEYLNIFLSEYSMVFNYVDKRNSSSGSWLEKLGFEMAFTDPNFGVDKIPFNLYIKERKHV